MQTLKAFIIIIITVTMFSCGYNNVKSPLSSANNIYPDSVWFEYTDLKGIGFEDGVSRRDPSDIIELDGKYYIWYTRIPLVTAGERTRLYNSGYYGTIWYATSDDGGFTWKEQGEALGPGPKGEFDSHAVFTPNILFSKNKYYLFYTAVKPTPENPEGIFENNSHNDFTAIGIAVSSYPDGPFERLGDEPALRVSEEKEAFDSYRVDDAVLVFKDKKFWLYYKGRSLSHGQSGPAHTMMGVAFSDNPEGPYIKHGIPILDRSHEVLTWHHAGGIAALASLSSTLEFSPDGLDFDSPAVSKEVKNRPAAPGLFRPHLTNNKIKNIPGWGISMGYKSGHIFLKRFEFKSE